LLPFVDFSVGALAEDLLHVDDVAVDFLEGHTNVIILHMEVKEK
jgi:hypothetical protein